MRNDVGKVVVSAELVFVVKVVVCAETPLYSIVEFKEDKFY